MKSIIQNKKECYLTGRTDGLHEHHVYFGTSNRKLSEKYGLKVWLTGELHNMGDFGVHGKYGHDTDLKIKQEVQQKAMEYYHWNTQDFIRIFGKNYL